MKKKNVGLSHHTHMKNHDGYQTQCNSLSTNSNDALKHNDSTGKAMSNSKKRSRYRRRCKKSTTQGRPSSPSGWLKAPLRKTLHTARNPNLALSPIAETASANQKSATKVNDKTLSTLETTLSTMKNQNTTSPQQTSHIPDICDSTGAYATYPEDELLWQEDSASETLTGTGANQASANQEEQLTKPILNREESTESLQIQNGGMDMTGNKMSSSTMSPILPESLYQLGNGLWTDTPNRWKSKEASSAGTLLRYGSPPTEALKNGSHPSQVFWSTKEHYKEGSPTRFILLPSGHLLLNNVGVITLNPTISPTTRSQMEYSSTRLQRMMINQFEDSTNNPTDDEMLQALLLEEKAQKNSRSTSPNYHC